MTLAGALIAAALSFTTFLFIYFPEWRPDPRERSDAVVKSLALDKNVKQVEYFARVGVEENVYKRRCTREQLDSYGNVVYIQAETAGFKRSDILLRWFPYNADNKRRLTELGSNSRETRVFKPRAPIDRQIAEVWVPTPLPSSNTNYFIRFELYNGDVLRAFVDTAVFKVPAKQPGDRAASSCQLSNIDR